MFHVHYTPKQCLGKLQSIIFFVLNAFYCNHPPMNNPDRKGVSNRTPKYIYPPLSVVIRLQPKGGLSACVRIDQKSGTKDPDLFSQIRINLVEVTGFEPATFWSRTKRATKLRYTSWWSQWRDLNPRPADYESAALPTELHWRIDCQRMIL